MADALDVKAAKQQMLADRVAGKRRNRAARNWLRAAKHQVPIFLVMASLAADVEGDPVDEKGRILTGGWTDFYIAMALSVHERLHAGITQGMHGLPQIGKRKQAQNNVHALQSDQDFRCEACSK